MYNALVKQSNISSNPHWTSLFSEMLDRLTTMFSHQTLCSAMFRISSRSKTKPIFESKISIALKYTVKCWIVWQPCLVTKHYVQRCSEFPQDQKQSQYLSPKFLLFSNIQWNFGSFDPVIQHYPIGARAVVWIFPPLFDWFIIDFLENFMCRPACDSHLFTIFTSHNEIGQFQKLEIQFLWLVHVWSRRWVFAIRTR